MRILIESPPGTVADGWGRALTAKGHECTRWDHTEVPAFDAFDDLRPEVVLVTREVDLDRVLAAHPGTRLYPRMLEPGFDSVALRPGVSREGLACDLAYCGDVTPAVVGFCEDLHRKTDLNIKVWGAGRSPLVCHLGSTDNLPDVVASAEVCVTFDRTDEWAFTAAGLGGIVVGPFPNKKKYRYLLGPGMDQKREEMRSQGQAEVLQNHTYFHRAAQMFHELGLDREAGRMIS